MENQLSSANGLLQLILDGRIVVGILYTACNVRTDGQGLADSLQQVLPQSHETLGG